MSSWSDVNNWLGGVVADGIDANAFFVYNSPADTSGNITLDTSRTVGNIYLEDTDGVSSSSISIANQLTIATTLTLQTTPGTTPVLDAGLLLFQGGKKGIIQSAATGSLTLAGDQGFIKLVSANFHSAAS